MNIDRININDKLALFSDHWNPRIIGELNGQHVKLVKFQGEFVWHKHDNEDEMFYVLKGTFRMHFRDKIVELSEKECIIVPKGVEHKPIADTEVSVMLFEPIGTVNTGDTKGELTQSKIEKL
jgi:mannose-6-phosphate isomerase-like protein (cupin superfamily)